MQKSSRAAPRAKARRWYDSAHASLCVLGAHLCLVGFFRPWAEQLRLKQKAVKYTPVQQLTMLFVALLAGAKSVYHVGTTLRVDRALQAAFGLPGCADQSTIADTLDAATPEEVAALRAVVEATFVRYSQARRHDFARGVLVVDLDLSPLPASKRAEGSERGYMGRCRSKTGRKLVRVRAADDQETVWEDVVPGNTAESLAVLKAAVEATERLLGLDREGPEVQAKRAQTEWRLDSGWGGEAMLNWLLARGYHVTGKFKSNSRVQKLVKPITTWRPAGNDGREVATVPAPVPLARPTHQFAVRTPSKDKPSGYYHAVLVTTRLELAAAAVVAHYDGRAAVEAAIKGDKRGLGLGVLRKHKLAAQTLVVLLGALAHNVLVWSRAWLAKGAPPLQHLGIVRLVQEVWAVPGRVKLVADAGGTDGVAATDDGLRRVRLKPEHPLAREVGRGLRQILPAGATLGVLG